MSIGWWAVVLLLAVCAACLAAAIGLGRGARWGHRVAVTMIAINLIGDIANTVLGIEPRALIGRTNRRGYSLVFVKRTSTWLLPLN